MMRVNSILRSVSLAALVICISGETFAASPMVGEVLAKDQTFTYRLLDGLPSLDPQLNEDVEGSAVIRDLFEGLMNQDADGNIIPGVATGYKASDGNKTYTFTLRDNAKWSNGDAVTANDFVYAWQRAADPVTASPYSWYMKLMSIENVDEILKGNKKISELGVKALDDHTLEVKLSVALPYFAKMVAHATTFPSHKATVEAHGSVWTRPGNIVSNGAYILNEWVLKERTVRVRNPLYWNDAKTIINKVITIVVNDENVALTRYRAGEFDRTEIPAGRYPALKAEFPQLATAFPRLCSYYYTFNLSDSGPQFFKNVKIRHALSYAIDRNVITENVLRGGQFPAYTFTPGATAGFEVPDVAYGKWNQSERDAIAVELLAEAGYSKENPLKFNLLYNTSEAHKKIATIMSQMWKQKLGVEAKLSNMEWKTFLSERGNQNFELARGAWCGDYNEASTFLDLVSSTSGYNDGKFSNHEVDRLMEEAKTSADPAANYTRVEQIMADEMPVIPIYHYTGSYIFSQGLKGWPVNNVEQKWYSRNLYKVAN